MPKSESCRYARSPTPNAHHHTDYTGGEDLDSNSYKTARISKRVLVPITDLLMEWDQQIKENILTVVIAVLSQIIHSAFFWHR